MERKASKNIWLHVMGALTLAMLAITICSVQVKVLPGICRLISLIFVALYGFWLYKIPHSNVLKYAMLLAAATEIINAAFYISNNLALTTNVIRLFAAAGMVYCAGRLNRIEQNKIILSIIDVILLIFAIITTINDSAAAGLLITFRFYGSFIMLTTLMIAYFVRYKEHKEAGLADAPKA